jgi:hypothetical protein
VQTSERNQLQVGRWIAYRLPDDQLPTDKDRLWHGTILHCIIDRPGLLDSVIVQSLDAGYEGDTECVFLEQIVFVEDNEVASSGLVHSSLLEE